MTSESMAARRLREIHELRLALKQQLAATNPESSDHVGLQRQLDGLDSDADDAELNRTMELLRRFKTGH
jgi:hypothetical protein